MIRFHIYLRKYRLYITFCVSSTYGYPSSRKNSLNLIESSSGAWMPAKTLPRSVIRPTVSI